MSVDETPSQPQGSSRGFLTDIRSYAVRHWNGDLPLATSFWVNIVLMNILLRIFNLVLEFTIIAADGGFTSVGAERMYVLWLCFLVALAVWQLVGCWASASKHVARGGEKHWAVIAQVLVVIGWIQLAYMIGLATELI